jgi:peptide/nickel transport system substrate-binding protein
MRFLKFTTLLALATAALLLSACRANPTTTPAPAPTTAATATIPPAPTATATAVPPKTLVICTQDEPQTLYIYGGSSRSMWSVLEAVYDGPYDTRGFSVQPVILKKIPTLADGDAVIRPVTVNPGDSVIDVNGNLVALQAGTRVYPSGCTDASCAVAWDGSSALSMDQLVVRFGLLPGIQWSDGQPLTAADSVYSYDLAADPATPTSKYLTDRTLSYVAVDDQTVEWTGLPGFYEQRFGTFFWTPLPKHAWGDKTAAALVSDPAAAQTPLGWGPYIIQEWVAGDHITLRKNPAYFRASEGLPKFDTLVYRFVGEAADSSVSALMAGECDVVDQNTGFLPMIPGLLQQQDAGKLLTYAGQGPEWEHLDFGIRPASYDDGYNPGSGGAASGDRVDFFGDVRTRQAFAYCINRQQIISDALYNRSVVPDTYLPPSHPLAATDLAKYPFDPQKGGALLDEVGWKDTDGNPNTPRVAAGVAGVPDGTPFVITYRTTEAGLRQQVSQLVTTSLAGCGIQATLQPAAPADLFGPGPQGPVFGRAFDLAQFSWEASARPNCQLYTSANIPGAANQWIGTNISGYSSPEFDAACAAASASRPSDADYAAKQQQVQAIFARDLPAIPLYFYPKIAISRPDLCGLDMDVTARSILWNIEALDYGSGCK